MIKKLFIPLFLFSFLSANDIMIGQKQNVLYIQNLIETEDKIAKNFEKYILTEFQIPTLENLRTDEYLGNNFSLKNRMGDDLAFKDIKELQLRYAISKPGYLDANKYIILLYNRDLYRDNTSASNGDEDLEENENDDTKVDPSISYVKIVLQSDEAKTIFNILKNDETIQKDCDSPSVGNYCNKNDKAIRYYITASDWIEYDKKLFEDGNVSTSIDFNDFDDQEKFDNLAVGAYILQVEEEQKYIKLYYEEETEEKYMEVK
ncbi:hypothetical protein [Poseidonibacter antarcticus]|uniref:hypothetical protein n=1 Tax=Poseidonibacter antarcticus TaxID=2478538 RepID=UPI000EF48203|nr:hypothetical protein [Poseidonibacter antarcticus]